MSLSLGRQIERHTDRQTGRQADRQTDIRLGECGRTKHKRVTATSPLPPAPPPPPPHPLASKPTGQSLLAYHRLSVDSGVVGAGQVSGQSGR